MRREHLPIVTPCQEDWAAMAGDEQRRRCDRCDHDVLHLSAMTADAARRALEARRGQRVCVRYACDADDNLVFAAGRPGPLRAAALATALAACGAEIEAPDPASAATTESCAPEPAAPARRETVFAGSIAAA